MPTPLGHALAGLAIYSIGVAPRERVTLLLICGFAAVAPDLDILPGLVLGQPARYHGGISHSLGFGVMVSLVLAGMSKFRGEGFIPTLGLCFLSYSSHLLLDWLGPDGRPPLGIPLFWPVNGEHLISPVPVLPGVRHAASTSTPTLEWLQGIFNLHNLGAVFIELLVMAPFLLLGEWLSRRRRAAKLKLEEMVERKP